MFATGPLLVPPLPPQHGFAAAAFSLGSGSLGRFAPRPVREWTLTMDSVHSHGPADEAPLPPQQQQAGQYPASTSSTSSTLAAGPSTDQASLPAIAPSVPPTLFDFSFQGPTPAAASQHLSRPRPQRVRESKFAPLLRARNPIDERTKRRDAYAAAVKERGDAKRYDARGESSLRRDFLSELREWEATQARAAEAWQVDPEEVEEGADPMDEWLEEYVEEEEAFFLDEVAAGEAFLSSFPEDGRSSVYASDDEEWERLMLDITAEAEATHATPDHPPTSQGQGMDLS